MKNFQNEAKLIARLNNVNIVTIFDVEVRYKTLFIIYEYLEGESLEDMIDRQKAIPPDQALHFLRQLSSAMAFILKACEKDPKDRFQTPDQARDFLGLTYPERESIFSGLKRKNIRTINFELDLEKENDFLILQKKINKLVKKIDGISLIDNEGKDYHN